MNYRKTFFALLAGGLLGWEVIDFMKSRQQPKQWTFEQKNIMIHDCIKSSKVLSSIDTATANSICSCAMGKIINKYSYEEIWKLDAQAKQYPDKIINLVEPLMQECMTPHLKEIKEQMEITGCITVATRKNKMTKEQAKKYCNCFITYLHDKYSEQQLNSIDSIMKIEMDKAKECMENPTN